jgi:hypothetical protein
MIKFGSSGYSEQKTMGVKQCSIQLVLTNTCILHVEAKELASAHSSQGSFQNPNLNKVQIRVFHRYACLPTSFKGNLRAVVSTHLESFSIQVLSEE